MRRHRRQTRRRSLWTPAVVLGLITASVLSACGASKDRPTASGFTGSYLALGDSIAFGYRPGAQRPAPDYHDASSFVGYPEYVGRALGLSVVNASCPGETAASLTSASGQSNGCENVDGRGTGYRDTFPLHVRYSGSQLRFAVEYLRQHRGKVGLVTIDLGANDVAVCVAVTSDGCASPSEQESLEAEISNGLATIYHAIRDPAGYHGRLVALTYYPDSFTNTGEVQVVTTVNRLISTVTKQYGGQVASGYAEFAMASRSSGGLPCAAGLLVRLPGGGCDEHPSAKGQRLLAETVEAAVRR
jgi:lysophospholipase L1-like esterase